MNKPTRYVLLVVGIILMLHSILSFSHESYGRATSLSAIASHFSSPPSAPYRSPNWEFSAPGNSSGRANATFVMLARNSDIDSTVRSVREAEDRFNRRHGYPWVFLNDEDFTEDFKRRVGVLVSGDVHFGTVPRAHWVAPPSIDEVKADAARQKMSDDGIIYGGSLSYRNMCRFNSGFFFKHELLQPYRYYWRVEPDVHFHCDVTFDPFAVMEQEGKVYGFTIAMYEFEATIRTLWATVREFMQAHPEYIAADNAMGFLSDNGGETYNLCHFWSNFEIADMDFWRGEAYSAFFDFLDEKGGFYYERWGDAPVHSIAASLFVPRSKLVFFDAIGYEHNPYTHCPADRATWEAGKCGCDPARSFDYDGYSCMRQWDRLGR